METEGKSARISKSDILDTCPEEKLHFAACVLVDSLQRQWSPRVKEEVFGELYQTLRQDRVWLDDRGLEEIFNIVSLSQEVATERLDHYGRFDESAIAWDVSRPGVDLMARNIGQLSMGMKESDMQDDAAFSVLITHDVDRTTTCELTSAANALLRALGLRRAAWWRVRDALSPGSLPRVYERLLTYEKSQGVGARFFMMSGPAGLGRHSSRTDMRWRSSRQVSRLIQQAGMRIGLHGSFAARETNSYRQEKEIVEEAVGAEITTHRNHYLRIDTKRIYSQLEEAGIRYDFSVGLSGRLGFRAGMASVHRTFDISRGTPSGVFSVPLIFMDTVLRSAPHDQLLQDLRSALEQVKAVRGCVSLLFHPELFLADSGAWIFFQRIIEMCRELGANLSGELPVLRD